jgi:ubiquinone/menaquinone biosynthesis C-methylase UbiE
MNSTALQSFCSCVNYKLQTMRESVSAQDYHTVVSLVERKAPIDYDRFAEAFALHYLWPNTLKAKRAIESSKGLGRSFIDLGCGPGSASLGALMASLDGGVRTPRKFLLIDRSLKQIELAGDILKSVREGLGMSFAIDVLQADALELSISNLSVGYDTVLISHLIRELDQESKRLTQQLASGVSANNRVVIIEQVDDSDS